MRYVLSLFAFGAAMRAQQSVVEPGGASADLIYRLGVFFLALLGAIFLTVISLTIGAVMRRHKGIGQEPLETLHTPSEDTERRLLKIVGSATLASVAILLGLIVVSVMAGKTTAAPGDKAALVVEVTGNQWWWYVRYPDDYARRIVVTANELHIPVGQRVMIRGTSNDVIHSFWVPGLQGKRDLIPSRVTTEWIQADRPGRWRGQCAEFCGLQHAHMALWVVADSPADFEKWRQHQTEPSIPPASPELQHGEEVFLNSGCVLCHSIEGTPARGQAGPSLTHFGSRLTLAAGTLPNNRGNLAGWISDPQNVKPGNHMATIPVRPEDMQPLIDYLESLL